MPVEALVEAALSEADPNVAGALRWALAQSGEAGLALLAEGLASPEADVRERAVQSIAEVPSDAATGLLRDALDHADAAIRRHAALALGTRGVADTVPTLVEMVVDGGNDVEAGDALGALAADPELAERIAARIVAKLSEAAGDPLARRRLAQALAGIPGTTASRTLADLAHDEDRAVAVTATYVLKMRDKARDQRQSGDQRRRGG